MSANIVDSLNETQHWLRAMTKLSTSFLFFSLSQYYALANKHRDAKMYEHMNNVHVILYPSFGKIHRKLYAVLSRKWVMSWFCAFALSGKVLWLLWLSYLSFTLKRSKTKFTSIIIVSEDVWQSYLAHPSPILHPVYTLWCFVTNLLLVQFTHFLGYNYFGWSLVCPRKMYFCMSE